MKVCSECQAVYLDRFDYCPECECEDYKELIIPFYDDWEEYIKDNEHI